MGNFLRLLAQLTAVAAVMTFIIGTINHFFDLNLGLGIGGTAIELPKEFGITVALSVVLLMVAALFELMGNAQKTIAFMKKHRAPVGAALLCSVGAVGFGIYSLMGGPLGMAVESGNSETIIKLLSENSYDPSELGDHLYQTLKRGDLENSEALLKHGADPNRVKGEFKSPLLASACIFFPKDSIKLLLEHRADPNLTDSMGRTAAVNLLLYRSTHFPTETPEDTLELLQDLQEAGADLTLASDDGKSAKDLALEKNSEIYGALFTAP